RVAVVDASHIAREEIGLPITNTTMLGALVKAVEIVKPESLIEPLKNRFGRLADRNIKAFERAYKETRVY
ncbi:MAG: pyruvate synthase, partial [Deltaproteobacteria bacterium]